MWGVLGGEGVLGWPLVAARQQGSSAVLASLCLSLVLGLLEQLPFAFSSA